MEVKKKKRGAPFGNQNGRTHGFYSRFLTKEEKQELEVAEWFKGMDRELGLIKVRLHRLLENSPDRLDLQEKAVNMIARMVQTRHGLAPKYRNALKPVILEALKKAGLPLDLKYIP